MFKVSVALDPMAVVTPFKAYDNTRLLSEVRVLLKKVGPQPLAVKY
jgi:hypothetical protein